MPRGGQSGVGAGGIVGALEKVQERERTPDWAPQGMPNSRAPGLVPMWWDAFGGDDGNGVWMLLRPPSPEPPAPP